MLKFEIDDNGSIREVAASGSCIEVAAQMAAACTAVYSLLSSACEGAGEDFRAALVSLVREDGAAWDKDLMLCSGDGECSVVYVPVEDEE